MGESFYVNINCSKVLENCDESQYTMFIDSTKMSIVYELTEWIRWIFSIDRCVFLMHENSVIHELEDIRFLSKLKNFEIRPCGQPNCVHKKTYRTLLNNLNLFVSWNNLKVHKYFLDKIAKIEKMSSEENHSENSTLNLTENSIHKKAKTDYNKFFSNIQTGSGVKGTPLTKKQVLIDNYISKPESEYGFLREISCNGNVSQDALDYSKDNFNSLNDSNKSEKEMTLPGFKITTMSSSPFKKLINTNKNNRNLRTIKSSPKYVRPFSVGELLSNIRDDFQKQNVSEANQMHITSQRSPLKEENNSNSFLSDDNTTAVRKRSRVRRRRRPVKKCAKVDHIVSPFLCSAPSTSAESSLNVPKSSRPNHIRFYVDDLREGECFETAVGTENQNIEDVEENSGIQTEPENFTTEINDKNESSTVQMENGFTTNDSENKMELFSSFEDVPQTETTTKPTEVVEKGSQSGSTADISKPLNQDVNLLLQLKEKFKNAVVVERFY